MNQTTVYRGLSVEQLVEDAELRDRVNDLEADNRALRELLCVALDNIRALTIREKRMAHRLRELALAANRANRMGQAA